MPTCPAPSAPARGLSGVQLLTVTLLLALTTAAPLPAAAQDQSPSRPSHRSRPRVSLELGYSSIGSDRTSAYEQSRVGSFTGSAALLFPRSPAVELGLEAALQRSAGLRPSAVVPPCEAVSPEPCQGPLRESVSGHLTGGHVGVLLRWRPMPAARLQPVVLLGAGVYAHELRSTWSYHDDRGPGYPLAGPFAGSGSFGGLGGSVGLGLEGNAPGRLRWNLAARAHGAIAPSGDFVETIGGITLTAGITLP